jgi:hypothetical protein
VPGPVHRVYALGSLAAVGNTEGYNYGLVTKFY